MDQNPYESPREVKPSKKGLYIAIAIGVLFVLLFPFVIFPTIIDILRIAGLLP